MATILWNFNKEDCIWDSKCVGGEFGIWGLYDEHGIPHFDVFRFDSGGFVEDRTRTSTLKEAKEWCESHQIQEV